jgi:hypothetical protein
MLLNPAQSILFALSAEINPFHALICFFKLNQTSGQTPSIVNFAAWWRSYATF